MLPPPIRGFRSRHINALLSEVQAVQPLAGLGVSVRKTPQGTIITADAGGGGGSAPFAFRWRTTLETVTDDPGATTYTLHIQPGSLWRDEGAGAVDLNVAPDGSTVTVASVSEWLAAGVTASGALYVVDDSGGATSGGVAYPLVYGNPTSETRRILLRVADLAVASSGVTLVQRQVGDALTGGASGLQLGPMELRFSSPSNRIEAYLGSWAFDEAQGKWVFAKAVKPDGTQYPPAISYMAAKTLVKSDDEEIRLFQMPLVDQYNDPYLFRTTIRVSQGISVNPPTSDTDTGSVSETTRDLIYFTDDTTANASTNYPLSIQVAEANEATAYEQSN